MTYVTAQDTRSRVGTYVSWRRAALDFRARALLCSQPQRPSRQLAAARRGLVRGVVICFVIRVRILLRTIRILPLDKIPYVELSLVGRETDIYKREWELKRLFLKRKLK